MINGQSGRRTIVRRIFDFFGELRQRSPIVREKKSWRTVGERERSPREFARVCGERSFDG